MNLDTSTWKPFLLKRLFNISSGNKLDKNKMSFESPCVNFVSRISYDNGVDTIVDEIDGIVPFSPGLITVSLGGEYLGSAYVQEEPFYTAQNVAILEARYKGISHYVKLFICTLIKYESNTKFYAFGRELNSHINKDFYIYLPVKQIEGKALYNALKVYSDDGYVPDWKRIEKIVKSLHHKPIQTRNRPSVDKNIDFSTWKEFELFELFDLKGGFYNKKPEQSSIGDIPFLGSTDFNNGVTEYYNIDDIRLWSKTGEIEDTLEGKIFQGNCIAVTVNGSVCNAYYQYDNFTCSHDITAFYLKNHCLNAKLALFLCTIIECEKPRWSYGRKPHDVKKFGKSIIKIPVKCDANGIPIYNALKVFSKKGFVPDWDFMERFIKDLPFGDRL